ncbi:MAG: bifunctional nuclease family protein [Spirochaetes bacterium]|nr:bifunctional nuclease family protein [Spirochaetota bacterium]
MTLAKVEIGNIYIDQKSGVPVVILKDLDSNDSLPILIAPLEASLIAIELEGKKPLRPLTHDLIVNILSQLSYQVESIDVYDLKENIYYARINLIDGEKKLHIDSRPSDAIALALRTKSPIYVERKLFAMYMGIGKIAKEVDKETLKEFLENIDIEDAGGKIM